MPRSLSKRLLAAAVRALLVAAAALSCCTVPRPFHPFPGSTALDAGGGELDVVWVDDFAFVDVSIDGKPGGRFLLDTGASVVLVTPRFADALGLTRRTIDRERGGYALAGANASSAAIERVVPVAELRCGPLAMRDFDAMEIDTTPLQQALGYPIDGVLPATAFRDVLLIIDYTARRVEVGATRAAPAAAPNTLALLRGSLPQVSLGIGDVKVSILLDSGSSEFLTLPEDLPLRRRGQPAETGRQQTIGAAMPTYQVRVDENVDLAGHTLAEPIIRIGRERRGAAGAALLRHFRVELDQPNRRVRFVRPSTEPLKSPPVRGPGLGFRRDETHWTIAYLLDATPEAGSGLRVGDQVVAIDGIAVGEMSRGRYEQLVAQRDALRFRVRAAAGLLEVDVPVAVLVP